MIWQTSETTSLDARNNPYRSLYYVPCCGPPDHKTQKAGICSGLSTKMNIIRSGLPRRCVQCAAGSSVPDLGTALYGLPGRWNHPLGSRLMQSGHIHAGPWPRQGRSAWRWQQMTEKFASPQVFIRRDTASQICDVVVLVRGQEMVLRCPSYSQALKWARLECKSYKIPQPDIEPLNGLDHDEEMPLFLRSPGTIA